MAKKHRVRLDEKSGDDLVDGGDPTILHVRSIAPRHPMRSNDGFAARLPAREYGAS